MFEIKNLQTFDPAASSLVADAARRVSLFDADQVAPFKAFDTVFASQRLVEEHRVAQEALQKISQLAIGSGLTEFTLSASVGRLMAGYALPARFQFPSVEELESEDLTASRVDSIIQMVRSAAEVVRGLRLSPRVIDFLIYFVCQVAVLYWQQSQGAETEKRILSALRELAVELQELKEAQPKEQKPVFSDLHRFVCIVKQLRSPEGNA